MPHHWCQWGGGNSFPSLVSVGGGIVPHCWCMCGRNSAPSLVLVTPMMGHYSSH
ncbi:unnamed protein product [Staurois parvus]|uniref:Uncharacterized protein n=1 Tax=Staurois parvus TaxID=386267 RepID=A0ABN9AQK7_9NEOB|nr:unnamed protein product [Staurois parvus]